MSEQVKDIYDREVERLTREPHRILESWDLGDPLFRSVTPEGWATAGPDGKICGCLTQIRRGNANACSTELTQQIRSDDRIPIYGLDIRPEHLPVFAYWQRRIDKELNRKPPEE